MDFMPIFIKNEELFNFIFELFMRCLFEFISGILSGQPISNWGFSQWIGLIVFLFILFSLLTIYSIFSSLKKQQTIELENKDADVD